MGIEIGIELGERLAELIDFFGGAVDLEAEKLGDGESFLDAGTDVFEVTEHSGGPCVGFAAEDNVIADREIVVVAGVLGAGAGYEFLHGLFEGVEFARLNLEVGVNADGLREFAHREIVYIGGRTSSTQIGLVFLIPESRAIGRRR